MCTDSEYNVIILFAADRAYINFGNEHDIHLGLCMILLGTTVEEYMPVITQSRCNSTLKPSGIQPMEGIVQKCDPL